MKEKRPAQTSLWQTLQACWHFQPFYARGASGLAAPTDARHCGEDAVEGLLWQLNGQALASPVPYTRSARQRPMDGLWFQLPEGVQETLLLFTSNKVQS